MEEELSRNNRKNDVYGTANNMSKEEKQISFLNRYFVFRKTHHVNAEKIGKMMAKEIEEKEEEEEREPEKPKKHVIKRIKKKNVNKIEIE